MVLYFKCAHSYTHVGFECVCVCVIILNAFKNDQPNARLLALILSRSVSVCLLLLLQRTFIFAYSPTETLENRASERAKE